MSTAVFRDYDQAALDREYNNRAKVGAALRDHFAFYSTESIIVRADRRTRLNIAFGDSGAETLDIVWPDGGAAGAPVHVFIHGGYWKSLDSKDFTFVANSFAPRGVITVITNYGLMPHVTMAEQVEHSRRAMAWVHDNIAAYGGDPGQVFVSGHSAGGHLAAMMLATDWPAWRAGLPGDMIKGGAGISGLYDLEPVQKCFVNADLKLDDDDVARFSTMRLPQPFAAPLYLPFGAKEGPEYTRHSEGMAAAWSRNHPGTRAEAREGHDHFSIVQEMNDPGSPLSRAVLAQMGLA